MSPDSGIPFLNRLARLYGIQIAFYDVTRHRRQASPESLLDLLRSLGAPVETDSDVRLAFREKWRDIWQRPLEPVNVIRDGEPPFVEVHLPSALADSTLACHLTLEADEEHSFVWQAADSPADAAMDVEGEKFVVKYMPLDEGLPWGYHRLTIELPGKIEETMLVSAPARAYTPPAEENRQGWGVFLPLYALHGENSLGSGDFSDLARLIDWTADIGGNVVATLPLLTTFMDREEGSSPYLPVSRLTWNDFFLDIEYIPELRECPSAQAILSSASFKDEVRHLRDMKLVDYHRQSELKRPVLEELSRYFFATESRRLKELRDFARANPAIDEYACFMATLEKQQVPWRNWKQPLRDGVLKKGDYDENVKNYYLYLQWLATRQMEDVAAKSREKGVRLYLDLPLGVHPDGYDVWHEPDSFIRDVSTGAPPDTVFTRGQDWGFQPLHPRKIRERGYSYVISYLRHHLEQAGILRIDHMMGFHRLFTIPAGSDASHGVYLRYRAEELYAILALESQRHKAIIVGEDLGTVPPYVRPAMNENGLQRMYVLHYELASNREKAVTPVPRNVIASLNTHDMHPFAAFWQEIDIDHRRELGLTNDKEAIKERSNRRKTKKKLIRFLRKNGWLKGKNPDASTALEACLSFLGGSRAQTVLVNLEDLWLETRPQNVPSTHLEHPNWQNRALHGFDEFSRMPKVVVTLQKINRLRRQGKSNK